MNAEFFEAIEDIEKEKGIPREYMYDKIKQAMLAAFRRDNPECEDNVDIILEEDKKRIEMNVNKTVVDEVEDTHRYRLPCGAAQRQCFHPHCLQQRVHRGHAFPK